jgi:hypothetical protein
MSYRAATVARTAYASEADGCICVFACAADTSGAVTAPQIGMPQLIGMPIRITPSSGPTSPEKSGGSVTKTTSLSRSKERPRRPRTAELTGPAFERVSALAADLSIPGRDVLVVERRTSSLPRDRSKATKVGHMSGPETRPSDPGTERRQTPVRRNSQRCREGRFRLDEL